MKATRAGAMNCKRSFGQSSLRYVFIMMRLRLSAVFGDRQRVDRIRDSREHRNYLDQPLIFERSTTKITSTITRTQALTVAITAPTQKSFAVFTSTSSGKLTSLLVLVNGTNG